MLSRVAQANVAAVALLASAVACSGSGSGAPIKNSSARASASPPALSTSAPNSPWFVGHWLRHGTALDIATSDSETPAHYVADLRFRIYRFCGKHVSPPCDPKVTRNLFDVGGLIRIAIDANGVGAVFYSNDSTRTAVKVRDALVLQRGQQSGTLRIQDVTRPLADFAGLVFCRPGVTARACGQ